MFYFKIKKNAQSKPNQYYDKFDKNYRKDRFWREKYWGGKNLRPFYRFYLLKKEICILLLKIEFLDFEF